MVTHLWHKGSFYFGTQEQRSFMSPERRTNSEDKETTKLILYQEKRWPGLIQGGTTDNQAKRTTIHHWKYKLVKK
jgi:hypothetical protein